MTATWNNRKIGEIVESTVVGLVRNKESQGDNKEFIYVKMHNITPGNQLDLSKVVRVDATAKEYEKYSLRNGDFLFNTRNSHELVGKSCIFRSEYAETVLFNNNIMRIRFRPEVNSRFVSYLFSTPEVSKQLEDIKSGTTNVSAIYYSSLQNIVIKYPPLPEQKRIVSIVDEAFEGIDRAIANTKKNLTNARELFESYLNAIFIQRDNEWVETELGDIATFRNGLNFTKNSKGKSIRIAGVKDFQNNFWLQGDQLESVTIDGELKEIDILRKGDILTVRSNGNKELIGRCILVGDLSEKTSHSGFTIRIRIEREDIYLPFIVHFLKSKELRKQLTESGGGINISSLNQQGLSLIMMSFPSFGEQKAIVESIDELAVKTQRLEAIYQQKLAALNELKQSILQKAFTGELTADTTNQATKIAKETIAA